uniref:C2 NT-type domain-containing protein n=1 Tax=Aegilops tauschii subsp. strangulata TaxID=200361 RepID=A0A453Q307_AEGTS
QLVTCTALPLTLISSSPSPPAADMVGSKTHHHASSSLLPEELNLLQKARCSPDDGNGVHNGGGGGRSALGQWKCRLLDSLRPRRPRCVVCLQVQHVTGMPPAAEGRGVVVGWRSKGGEGEHTAPARVSRGGAAAFDEVFLHYFTAGGSTLRSFTVWAALVEDDPARGGGGGGDLGAFPVDLAEAAVAESSHPQFGGKALSFQLGGAAAAAVLTVSVYCRVMEQEEIHGANGHARERKNKGKSLSYASCLPDLSCLRTRPPPAGAPRRATSLRSERGGFITIENSVTEMEEEEGFITMEKGTVSSRSRRAALALEALAAAEEEAEDEKPCLFMELSSSSGEASALEVEGVEEEFLAMLEDKYWAEMARSKEIEKGLSVTLDAGLDLGLDLDSLIRDAETELARAEQAWRSKVGAAIVEEEEYKELVRRWGSTTRDRDREQHVLTT